MANGTIAFDTLQTSGQITGTAKSLDTDYVVNGSAKMVINYDQITDTIRSSLNVSSVSDDATGQFTITFTASKNDINYSPSSASMAMATSDRVGSFVGIRVTSQSTPNARSVGLFTGSLKIDCGFGANASGAAGEADNDANCVQTFGDLA
tara:strand:+ start:406 stop:855 length:450 start_codon:yes stop_codon:yes gene_type:complete